MRFNIWSYNEFGVGASNLQEAQRTIWVHPRNKGKVPKYKEEKRVGVLRGFKSFGLVHKLDELAAESVPKQSKLNKGPFSASQALLSSLEAKHAAATTRFQRPSAIRSWQARVSRSKHIALGSRHLRPEPLSHAQGRLKSAAKNHSWQS